MGVCGCSAVSSVLSGCGSIGLSSSPQSAQHRGDIKIERYTHTNGHILIITMSLICACALLGLDRFASLLSRCRRGSLC